MRWGYPLDIWQAACLFYYLTARRHLFDMRSWKSEGNEDNIASHLSQMVALLGPPPADFVSRSNDCKRYVEDDGAWKLQAD